MTRHSGHSGSLVATSSSSSKNCSKDHLFTKKIYSHINTPLYKIKNLAEILVTDPLHYQNFAPCHVYLRKSSEHGTVRRDKKITRTA